MTQILIHWSGCKGILKLSELRATQANEVKYHILNGSLPIVLSDRDVLVPLQNSNPCENPGKYL